MILVTGGAGFIGSNFIKNWLQKEKVGIINLDKLTYAGNLRNLEEITNDKRHIFIEGDIVNRELLKSIFQQYHPQGVIHFAAETHVDRSISNPEEFIQTNTMGTFNLLAETHRYWQTISDFEKQVFRFVHVSTDEVYGSLKETDQAVNECAQYAPNNPYSASKASSDHFVRSFRETYDLPTIITHCSNNYGPFQFPEKFIPLIINNAINGKPLPLYGDGLHIRNWMYVLDHCEALRLVLKRGHVGEVYNIGDDIELTNREIAENVCHILDEIFPNSKPHNKLIKLVRGRPGHDRRYSIDSTKIRKELGWKTQESFETNIRKTVEWYANNREWCENVMDPYAKAWLKSHYQN